ncbi:aromatic amino acid ammonia-lyase [Specibacter cremeus]|uniref:aromatic amino acid ammonia-lyase n=1 Tax=Specibacter cremeus TaxID=1629051 RepID=UPI000F7829C8|nr:aromatic amino acid ammonia-lyase [Specibacter cremeus]
MNNHQTLAREATRLEGTGLTCHRLADLVRTQAPIDVDTAAVERVAQSHAAIASAATNRPVYGRTTGVGANRSIAVEGDRQGTDVRLLRSHGTGSGPWLPSAEVRAAMIVRLNQLLLGGSGMHQDIVDAFVATLNGGTLPRVHAHGSIGTGDLSAFGEIALGLMGEAQLDDGTAHTTWQPHEGDALPLISTNAMTIAKGGLLTARLEEWLERYARVGAMSLMAVHGSMEPFAPAANDAHPHPGQLAVARTMNRLLSDERWESERVQDSYGFRALPQVAGALAHAIELQTRAVETELNSAAENPFVSIESRDVFHNANFHTIELALAVDHTKLALSSAAHLSLARLNDLSNPAMTGFSPFLSVGEPGSSGIMLLEYNAAAALSRLRTAAQPSSLASVVISRGTEDHASFSTQAVDQLGQCLEAASVVLACELIAGVRALTLQKREPRPDTDLGRCFREAVPLLGTDDLGDRSLSDYLANAIQYITTTTVSGS